MIFLETYQLLYPADSSFSNYLVTLSLLLTNINNLLLTSHYLNIAVLYELTNILVTISSSIHIGSKYCIFLVVFQYAPSTPSVYSSLISLH